MGNAEEVIAAIKNLTSLTEDDKETIKIEINYFERNKEGMRYKKFRDPVLLKLDVEQ